MAMAISNPAGKQHGVILIEGLIALLIFSMGILALVGLQALSISFSTAAKYRIDASYLADQIVGQMWASVGNSANLASYACNPCTTGNGNAYTQSWVAQIEANQTLPGAISAISPQIIVNGQQVTVTISWRAPNEQQTHSYSLISNITRNY